jgi:peptide/nickel transport system permease protein
VSRNRAGRELRAGLGLLAVLWLLALAAPLLAGSRPLLQRSGGRTYLPAVARLPLLGWLPGREAPPPRPGDLVVMPPVPHDPLRVDLRRSLQPPSPGHPLGTDSLGRDVAARLLHGARTSLVVGGAGTGGALALGLLLGGLAGFYGGGTDRLVSALVDVALCFPSLVLAMALVAVTDARGPWALVLVLALTRWGRIARYARGEVLRMRTGDLIGAARAAGAGDLRILVGHLLPNALAPVLMTAAFSAAGAVLLEGALGFLGLGIAPPQPSWGASLADGWAAGGRAWWLSLFPGAGMFLALAAYGLVGEGFLDRLDPRREAARAVPARATAV